MILSFVAVMASVMTLAGGYFALYFKDRLHLILGFSAGAVVAVSLFDLLPEAIDLGKNFYEVNTIMLGVIVGFLSFLIMNRFISLSVDERKKYKGDLGAGLLSLHSMMDGLMIGLSFQVSFTLGLVVTCAVLVHDFSDGVNTVNFSLLGNDEDSRAKNWLIVDALAPAIGILISLVVSIQDKYLSLVLAFFAGSFLYIGASELIPESQHRHPFIWTSIATILGVIGMYTVIHFASI